MEIKHTSFFRDPENDRAWLERWVESVERHNGRSYERITVRTALGATQVYGLSAGTGAETLVIFPGARTSVLFWDLDRGLEPLLERYRIFLVETNGLPNLSDGQTPDIRSGGYGEWASQVLDGLNVTAAVIAGASFGGLICMKLCIAAPEKVKAVHLLNPGCLQPFSLKPKNLFYNLLPILFPRRRNVVRFLDNAVFCKPQHRLSDDAENLLIDYEVFALTRYRDNTQKPYYMAGELRQVAAPVHLLVGDKDLLFPYQRSVANARKYLRSVEVTVFADVGHGIETFPEALSALNGHPGAVR